ncbi:MAG: TRAP transporter small permease [Desulfovibrionaceae bacterium]
MLDALDRLARGLEAALLALAGASLCLMMLLGCANMLLRSLGAPLPGTFELMGFFGALAAALALGATQRKGGHISVDLLRGKLPAAAERTLDVLGLAVSVSLFFLAGLETAKLGLSMVETGELSETLRFPYHPFVFAVAGGCFAMGLTLAVQLLRLLASPIKSGRAA